MKSEKQRKEEDDRRQFYVNISLAIYGGLLLVGFIFNIWVIYQVGKFILSLF